MQNNKIIKIGNYFEIGNSKPFFLMAGPCQAENLDHSLFMAESIKKICDKLNINYVFKASFDKANRTSAGSKRGVGVEEGMKIFEQVKKQVGTPIITDIHTPEQAKIGGEVCDIFTADIPYTDLSHKIIIVKKVRHTPSVLPRKGKKATLIPVEEYLKK